MIPFSSDEPTSNAADRARGLKFIFKEEPIDSQTRWITCRLLFRRINLWICIDFKDSTMNCEITVYLIIQQKELSNKAFYDFSNAIILA